MDKYAAQNYTLDIMEKVATLQSELQEAINNDADKNKIISAYYDLADSVIQIEDVIVELCDITEQDIIDFEKNNFLTTDVFNDLDD